MSRGLRWKVNWGFGAGIALLLGVTGLSYATVTALLRETRWVDQTRETLTELQKVVTLLQSLQRVERGYLLTGEVPYLERYTAVRGELEDGLSRFTRLYGDDRDAGELTPLRGFVAEEAAIIERTVGLRKESGFGEALQFFREGNEKRMMDEILREVVRIESVEEEELRTRVRRARRTARFTLGAIASASAVTVALGLALLWLINRDVSRRLRVERMKDELMAIASHELRTPLTSVLSAVGLLADGQGGTLTSEGKRLAEMSRRGAERLVRIVNDFLDVQKIEAGRLEFRLKPVEMGPFLRQAVAEMGPLGRERGVALRLEEVRPGLWVRADADRLMQVVTNLVSNAMKYSPSRGTVRVDADREDGQVRVAVRDEGPGIPEDFRPRVFQKFAQADAPGTRRKGGTGLGLSICKALVEMMGGRIGFDSKVGGGTTFHFHLPAVPKSG